MKRNPCLICLLAKRQRPPVSNPSGDRKDMKPGDCVSGDIVPIHPPAHDGSTMFFLFADIATGYMMAFTAKAKNAFLTAFIEVVKTMKKYGKEVKIFRSDSETVLVDGDMGKYLEENSYFNPRGALPELRRTIREHDLSSHRRITPRTTFPSSQTLGLGLIPRHRLQEPNSK